jgi:hypothetical protein
VVRGANKGMKGLWVWILVGLGAGFAAALAVAVLATPIILFTADTTGRTAEYLVIISGVLLFVLPPLGAVGGWLLWRRKRNREGSE